MNPHSLKRWLLASIVLNLFLVCGIAGGTWRWWVAEGAVKDATTAHSRGLRFAAEDLSAERRRAYLLGLRDARRSAAASIQAARDGRQEVLRLLGAPQFDRAAIAAALARTREADAAARVAVETSVIDFAATLSPVERQSLASGLARRSMLSPPAQAQSKP